MQKFGRLVCAIAAMLPFFGHAEFAYEFTATVNYKGTETLVDFPVLVRLPNVVTTHMREDGLDVRFFTADGATELEHECESFVRLEGALCWVKVPSLAEGTKLLVKCGDPDFDTPAAGASVWSSYIGVWHLDNVKTGTASAVDATGGTANGSASGSALKAVDGKVGTACLFINASWTADNIGEIAVNNTGSLATAGKLTTSWWMKPCNSGAMPRTMSKASYLLELREGVKNYALWNVRYQMAVDAAPTFELQNYQDRSAGAQSVSVADADTKLNLPDWLHLAFTIEDDAEHTSATGAIWADAVLQEQGELNPLLSAGEGGKLHIGKKDGGGDNYRGQMDELRIRAAVSSADWIKAEHDSVDDVDFVKLPDDLAKVFCVTHRVVATEAEQTGDWADAVVAGDDAWAAIQGVIDGCGVGDLILVKAGTYLLTNELAFASANQKGVTLRSDDGEGNLARKTTLLIGGYPATSNRLVRIATPEVIVEGFTLTNGFVNAAPGGGAYLDNCGADAGLRSCDIVGCTAWNEEYLTKDVGFSNGTGGGAYVKTTGCISNCLFKSNVSFAGAVSLVGTKSEISPPKDTPWVTHCEFVWNEQIGKGTANNCNGSAVASQNACCIDHCSIVSNFCNVTSGVQISTVGSKSGYLIVSNCVFRSNGLGKSNAMLLKTNSPSTIRCVGNTFIDETAGSLIGCIDSWGSDGNSMFGCSGALGATYVKNGFFYGNTSYSLGGDGAKVTAENCTFVNNKGAIYSNGGGTAASRTNRVVNCIFFDNEKDIYAVNSDNSKPNALFVSNCCIRASSLDMKSGSNRQFGLLVTNGCNIVYNGGQREYAARELIRFYANGRGDCHLRAGSALLGAGMTLGWMEGAVDADGNPRVAGGAPDIGCYERQAGTIDPPLPCTRAVATEADKKDEWADAIVGLQAAVDAAYNDEPVYVKAGTYNVAEPITLKNQGVLLIGEGVGATVVDGGYPARTNRLFTITQAGIRIEGMTLQNSAVAADGGAILVSHDDFTLDSCVVSNCCAGFEGSSETARYGGGVYVDSVYGNVLLTNTLFVSCAARLGGGVAVWKKDTSLSAWATRATVPVVSDCEFVADRVYAVGKDSSGRTGHGQGAGAFGSLWVEHSRFCGNFTKPTDNYASALTLDSYGIATNCLFENHLSGECATVAGRGDGTGGAKALITQCTFRGNSVPYLLMGHAIVENCQVVSNAFTLSTALDARENSTFKNMLFAYNTGVFGVGKLTYENCTFVTNEFGICVYVHNNAPTLRNCVSYGNTGTVSRIGSTFSGKADFCFERGWSANGKRTGTFEDNVVLGCRELPIYNGGAGATFDFCSLDKTGATSNLVAAVEKRGFKFVDPANGNFRLKHNSPLRDAGLTLDAWMTEDATDLDGKPRRISSDGKSYPDSLPDIGCYECDIPKPGFLLQVW